MSQDDWIDIPARPEKEIARERAKARELRASSWWKNELAKGICHYCGKKFKPSELTMDHVVPVARGGHSVRGNVVPCCKECNNRKKYLTPAEMILQELEENEKKKESAPCDTETTGS